MAISKFENGELALAIGELSPLERSARWGWLSPESPEFEVENFVNLMRPVYEDAWREYIGDPYEEDEFEPSPRILRELLRYQPY